MSWALYCRSISKQLVCKDQYYVFPPFLGEIGDVSIYQQGSWHLRCTVCQRASINTHLAMKNRYRIFRFDFSFVINIHAQAERRWVLPWMYIQILRQEVEVLPLGELTFSWRPYETGQHAKRWGLSSINKMKALLKAMVLAVLSTNSLTLNYLSSLSLFMFLFLFVFLFLKLVWVVSTESMLSKIMPGYTEP